MKKLKIRIREVFPNEVGEALSQEIKSFLETNSYLEVEILDPKILPSKVISTSELSALRDWHTQETEYSAIFGTVLLGVVGSVMTPFKHRDLLSRIPFAGHRLLEEDNMRHVFVTIVHNKNEHNLFSWFTKEMIFVQATDWEVHVPGITPTFLISFEIMCSILRQIMWDDDKNYMLESHQETMGCINDHAQGKKKVIAKYRGADLCDVCNKRADQKNVLWFYQSVIFPVIQDLRQKIVLQKLDRPPKLYVKGTYLHFPEMHDLKVKLSPLQALMLHFYLKHPEGVSKADLLSHKEELLITYLRILNRMKLLSEEARNPVNEEILNHYRSTVDRLCDYRENAFDEALSKMSKKLKDVIPLQAKYFTPKKSSASDRYLVASEGLNQAFIA